MDPARNPNHFRGCRHFQVQFGLDDLAKQEHIPVLNVTPILSQVTDDSNGTGQLCDSCCYDRVRLGNPPCLPNRSHMIHIDG
jgi:hypothetical protein